ncbi:MAG: hypothetical protein Kow00129_15240 [Thermoleophilia bacterium]
MNPPSLRSDHGRRLVLGSDLSETARLRAFLRELADELGFPTDRVFDIQVAVGEAAANAIEHAHGASDVVVEAGTFPDRLEVSVHGPADFHPPAQAEGREHRGLGLPLMATLSDHLALYSAGDGGTLVTLTFYRPDAGRTGSVLPPAVMEALAHGSFFEQTLNQLPDAFAIFSAMRDPKGEIIDFRVEYANDVACELVGRSGDDVIGGTMLKRYPQLEDSEIFECCRRVVGDGVPQVKERVCFNPEGNPAPRFLDYSFRPVGDGFAAVWRDVTERALMEEELLESRRTLQAELKRARALQELSTWLLTAEGESDFYDRLMDTAMQVLEADCASMQLFCRGRGPAGELELLAFRGFSREAADFWRWVHPSSRSTCGLALSTGSRVAVADVQASDLMAGSEDQEVYLRTGIRAVQTTPLLSRTGELLGVFSTHWREPHEVSESEERLLDTLARLAADLMERMRAQAALKESEEKYRALARQNERLYRQQYRIAANLQDTVLLPIPDRLGPVRISHLYRSATQAARVGGDFYDVFKPDDGSVAFLIGDVCGHGVKAAAEAAFVRDVVRAYAIEGHELEEVLHLTNEALIRQVRNGYATLYFGVLDLAERRFRYASAGHPPAMLRRGGKVQRLENQLPPLGVLPLPEFRLSELTVESGDLLLFYTDGVIEARQRADFFGEGRLTSFLESNRIPLSSVPDSLLRQVVEFCRGALRDDLAVLAAAFED